jgi:hypothetical protein
MRLGERAVGRQNLAVAHPHRGRGRGGLQRVAALELAGLDDRLREGAVAVHQLFIAFLGCDGFVGVDENEILHVGLRHSTEREEFCVRRLLRLR